MNKVEFLNIDLDIEAKESLTLIVDGFGSNVIILQNQEYNGLHYLSLETGYSEEDEIIKEYISLIDGLKPVARELWNNCIKREFNFGYKHGGTPYSFHFSISEKSIKALSKVGGSIGITIYS